MRERARCPDCGDWLQITVTFGGGTAERCPTCPYTYITRARVPTGPSCLGCGVEMCRRRGRPPERCIRCGGRGHAKPGARSELARRGGALQDRSYPHPPQEAIA